MSTGSMYNPAYGDDTPDTIRVAMFADLGSTYKSTTPAVTLKSNGDWSIGEGIGDEHRAWLQLSSGQAVRFSVDGFRVKVMETWDYQAAAAAAKVLQGTSDKPMIFTDSKNGGTVYQLYTGMYASAAAAQTAAARIAVSAAAQLNGQMPVATGNYHLSAGTFADEQEANRVRNDIQSVGFDAYTVLMSSGDYAVWVGEAASSGQLSSIREALAGALPEIIFMDADLSGTALIIRQDAGTVGGSAQNLRHYMLSGSDNGKVTVHGDGKGIQVIERSERTYRGDFEISKVSGQVALVNELPVDQYLYSVVGAEVYASWPDEALKAQAVAARSYALYKSNKFNIADVVDTTLSQAYNGLGSENEDVSDAVDATSGEVLMSGGEVIEAVFSANAGGATADPSEVWNGGGTVFASVDSLGDASAQEGTKMWYHVLLDNGKTGYVREDNVSEIEGVTGAGLAQMTVTADSTNVRPIPQIQSAVAAVAQMNPGDEAVVLGKVPESGSYAWVRGPFTSDQLLKSMQGKITSTLPAEIQHLDVTERGPSGRVMEVEANGQPLTVKYPDMYRSAMGSLPSTKFDISGTGSYTVLGADGQTSHISGAAGADLIFGSGKSTWSGSGMVVMNGSHEARVIDKEQRFIITGQGNGHGLGLSQWGAKGMADEGYDYKQILQHYYQNVSIVKE
ncbi:SpoIID/LytB domain-containing protein [Paenibacillus sp. P96]|uniref:SpoIID/LytB domain-containing protein n=2 Tax=Paenibacillus zeirhizosphaerae TaxID=2987519 RepID=A0ABT9FKC3_9BACL|nr:SpoIID/LytB domain-containing protein [Paenibacillus sp. P96]MDP4095189.1 SpoIID/LytB domain-containing protein [Paenibacillus sp. P96]